jgi:hypothetical protein
MNGDVNYGLKCPLMSIYPVFDNEFRLEKDKKDMGKYTVSERGLFEPGWLLYM